MTKEALEKTKMTNRYLIPHDKGFIEIERLSPPNANSMGMHRASAWLGTYEDGTFLSCFDYRSISGKEKAMKRLKEAIENGN